MAELQRAWFYKDYGTADLLELGDFPVPEIQPHQVLVKVVAAALNPIDFKRRQGYIKDSDSELPHVPGYDLSGIVVKVGSQVKQLKEGDEVYGDINEFAIEKPKRWGSLAQYSAVEEKLLALKPKTLTFAQAASLPASIQTAQGAFEKVQFQEGKSVLVIGGAGGVGSLAIQLAKEVYGASLVATTASTGKLEFVKALGADVAIDYTKEIYENNPEKYDFVLDTVGEVEKAVKVVKGGGHVVTIAAQPVPPATFFGLTSNGENLRKLAPYIESNKIKPIIDPKGHFKFSEAAEAFKYLETGRATGKIVISSTENKDE